MVRNTEDYVRDTCEHYGLSYKLNGGLQPHYDIGGFASIYILGGDNVRSYTKARGATIHSALIDGH